MSKRFVTITLLSVSVIGMLGIAEAHYVPTLSGWKWHSVQCSVDMKGVPNPTTNPATVECVAETAIVESVCVNPNGHFGFGSSTNPVTLIGIVPIGEEDITNKKKGIAHVEVIIGTADGQLNDPPLDSSFCANDNWTNVANLIRSFTTAINVFKCLDGDACQQLQLVSTVGVPGACTLPAQFNFDGYNVGADPFDPADDTCPNCPVPGTDYVCPPPVFTHVE